MKTLLLTLSLALISAGCGAAGSGGSSATVSGQLAVSQVIRGHLYIEGSIPHVTIASADGRVLVNRDIRKLPQAGRPLLVWRLAPGSYRLTAYQRPCSGNCGMLGGPTDRCSASFDVASGARLAALITLHPGQGCKLSFRAG